MNFIFHYLRHEWDKQTEGKLPAYGLCGMKFSEDKGWKWLSPNCPQQRNGHDCGVFVCQFAKCLVFGDDIANITQEFVNSCRSSMGQEIKDEILYREV